MVYCCDLSNQNTTNLNAPPFKTPYKLSPPPAGVIHFAGTPLDKRPADLFRLFCLLIEGLIGCLGF